ncbi:hypothetical protein SEA_WENTWORTH_69 [Streptomyces phage Wentworth]|nr:hypothetical protein SEA_WENTWORTH_69 [Streptomyces phage Wentworth]
MDLRDILFVLVLSGVPAAMAWRAYRLGYQQGLRDERRRQERRIRLSRRSNSR